MVGGGQSWGVLFPTTSCMGLRWLPCICGMQLPITALCHSELEYYGRVLRSLEARSAGGGERCHKIAVVTAFCMHHLTSFAPSTSPSFKQRQIKIYWSPGHKEHLGPPHLIKNTNVSKCINAKTPFSF